MSCFSFIQKRGDTCHNFAIFTLDVASWYAQGHHSFSKMRSLPMVSSLQKRNDNMLHVWTVVNFE